jgi:hypothetical protein
MFHENKSCNNNNRSNNNNNKSFDICIEFKLLLMRIQILYSV